ncbi:disease resistance protein RUN1-like [Eucalyptus grandis]|uniref:disease resistance protein RUN1-like n=1 Tax=Eucalyptus grandis TaxID=71139 RepID=UPI00192EE70D|nr:disease resistance protein RUN1-like [Eucalyptus grandis]
MCGVGKTALARIVYDKLSPQFDCRSFLHDVEGSCESYGLGWLQRKLLSSFGVPSHTDHIKDIDEGMDQIKRVCDTKKVLIVLDDLHEEEKLHYLAGKSNWFGSGSRIIITTKNKDILYMMHMESSNEEVLIQPRGILDYEVHEMELGQTLQLFYKHAFRRDSPVEGYDCLAEEIVHRYDCLAKEIVCKVGMLPLAVAVIGFSLYWEGLVLEQHFEKIELWEDMLDQLDECPIKEVRDALMSCFYRLDSIKPYVEALSLTATSCSRNFEPEELAALPHLRFLRVKGSNFSGDFKNVLSCLRWLSWQTCQTTFHAKNFHFNNLVVLDLSNSDIEDDWGGWSQMKMNKLKALDLTGCRKLKRTPNFSNFLDLEELILAQCVNLTTIDSSIGKLQWLKTLNVAGCVNFNLTTIDSSIGKLQLLETLNVAGCVNLTTIDSSIGKLKWLRTLNVAGCVNLTTIDSSIGKLQWLKTLNVAGCVNLTTIDSSIGKLWHLETLNMAGCSSLGELPAEFGSLHFGSDGMGGLQRMKMNRLKVLDLTGCRKLKRTPDFSNFLDLEELILAQYKELVKKVTSGFESQAIFDCLDDPDISLRKEWAYVSNALVHYLQGQHIYRNEDISELSCFIGGLYRMPRVLALAGVDHSSQVEKEQLELTESPRRDDVAMMVATTGLREICKNGH